MRIISIKSRVKKSGRQESISYLLLVKWSAAAAEGFGSKAQHFTDREKLIATLQPYLKKGVTLLIKGSRSMRMEKIVAGIIPDNELEICINFC